MQSSTHVVGGVGKKHGVGCRVVQHAGRPVARQRMIRHIVPQRLLQSINLQGRCQLVFCGASCFYFILVLALEGIPVGKPGSFVRTNAA